MIVLDTNVVSELMRLVPSAIALEWLARQSRSELFLTAVSEAELRYGVEILPTGRRRATLAASIERTIRQGFAERILPFDSDAAGVYGVIAAARRAGGNPISQADCQIAAIARSRGAAVATRDASGFGGCGIEVINPWQA
ncbi:MAG: type II toxin-antitoxin system VapC family toxin [Chloroflexota bacterium]|nr:type II toxin-antitoxin system VapC family toxin [Chloroflexota bacterium]